MKIRVPYRKWRYRDARGLELVITGEFKRLMQNLHKLGDNIDFNHSIIYTQWLERRDGVVYDIVEIVTEDKHGNHMFNKRRRRTRVTTC